MADVLKWVKNSRGARPPAPAPAIADGMAVPLTCPPAEAVSPPDSLVEVERAIWDAWAPLATAKGTLLPSTVAAFVALCELEADRRELRARVKRPERPVFLTPEHELSLRREVRALALAVRAGLKDFMISPFGKEIPSSGLDEPGDPLDGFIR